MTIALVDALNGFEMDIEHLDGHKVTLSLFTTQDGAFNIADPCSMGLCVTNEHSLCLACHLAPSSSVLRESDWCI